MVNIVFTVASTNPVVQNISVDVGGQQLPATIEALEVELVSDHYGSLHLQFVGAEKEDAKALFVVDSTHTWTVS